MSDAPEVTVQELERAVRMDIVISEPSAPKPAALESAEPSTPTTAEDIQKKLEEAAVRRSSLLSEKQSSLAAHLSKIEETHQRKKEKDAEFIKATKEALEQKLETAEEKKIQYLNDLKAKVKEELEKIQKHQESLEQQEINHANTLMTNIQEKLENAAEKRDQNTQTILKRLRDHEEAVTKALASQKEQLDALKEKINTQLDKATQNREARLQEIVTSAQEELKLVEERKRITAGPAGERVIEGPVKHE